MNVYTFEYWFAVFPRKFRPRLAQEARRSRARTRPDRSSRSTGCREKLGVPSGSMIRLSPKHQEERLYILALGIISLRFLFFRRRFSRAASVLPFTYFSSRVPKFVITGDKIFGNSLHTLSGRDASSASPFFFLNLFPLLRGTGSTTVETVFRREQYKGTVSFDRSLRRL